MLRALCRGGRIINVSQIKDLDGSCKRRKRCRGVARNAIWYKFLQLGSGLCKPLDLGCRGDKSKSSRRSAMQDHRGKARQRILKLGTISFGLGAAIDCGVRNMSEHGACLEVASPVGIPNEFTLVVSKDHLKRPCRIAWRSARKIGVTFA